MKRWHSTFLSSSIYLVTITGGMGAMLLGTPSVQAQTAFNDEQITRYARAVLAIEAKRQQIYADAKKSPDWAIASSRAEAKRANVCDIKNELPASISSLCQELIDISKAEVERNGFSNSSFNQITRGQEQDGNLRNRIQAKMMELRR